MLAGRLELDPRALGEGVHPEVHEELIRGSELVSRVDPASFATEPLSVNQVRTGQVEPKRRGLEPLDRLAEERLGPVAIGDGRPGPGPDARGPRAAAPAP